MNTPLVILGCGFTGTAAARLALAAGRTVIAVARSAPSLAAAAALGADARVVPSLDAAHAAALVSAGADVLVGFPPDGATDARVAPALGHARSIVYVSTTGVYGDTTGAIDDRTPVAPVTDSAKQRVAAERCWLDAGATVLRAAGIYGPFRGLHRRLATGAFKIPGDGANTVSRIHVEDLARLCLSAGDRQLGARAFVVADAAPVPQREVIEWLCREMGVAVPPSVPLHEVHETLRHDRAIDARGVLAATGLSLAYPTFREGYRACWDAERAAT